jgi:hypothetical protein
MTRMPIALALTFIAWGCAGNTRSGGTTGTGEASAPAGTTTSTDVGAGTPTTTPPPNGARTSATGDRPTSHDDSLTAQADSVRAHVDSVTRADSIRNAERVRRDSPAAARDSTPH